jgi:hypothetical protein
MKVNSSNNMNKIIFYITLFLAITNSLTAQNNTDNPLPNQLNTEEPMLNRHDLEEQYGGYKAPGIPEPLPTYKSPDNIYPKVPTATRASRVEDDGSLNSFENSLISPTSTKQGGSVLKTLAEVEKQSKETSNNNLQGINNVALFIFIILIFSLIIYLIMNKKNEKIDKKLDSTLENKIEMDTTSLLNNLDKLETLKNQGTISDEEFNILKDKLLKNF